MNNSISRYNLVLMISLAVVAILCAQYYFKSRELRNLQGLATGYQNNETMVNLLVNDCMEYSKINPAIDPILVSINAKPGKAAAPASPTAPSKPATK